MVRGTPSVFIVNNNNASLSLLSSRDDNLDGDDNDDDDDDDVGADWADAVAVAAAAMMENELY